MIVAGAYFIQAIGVALFVFNQTFAMVFPMLLAHHFGAGVVAPVSRVMSARYFGRKAFGSILGTMLMFILPAAVAAPIYAGWVYGNTQSYITVFMLSGIILALSTAVIMLAVPPKPPAQVSDIGKIV